MFKKNCMFWILFRCKFCKYNSMSFWYEKIIITLQICTLFLLLEFDSSKPINLPGRPWHIYTCQSIKFSICIKALFFFHFLRTKMIFKYFYRIKQRETSVYQVTIFFTEKRRKILYFWLQFLGTEDIVVQTS